MKEFILDGDVVKRLLYNKPLNDLINEYYFTDWILNSEQPSDGISIVNNKIIITKVKPNVWLFKSNYNLQTEADFLDKFYNKNWTLKNFANNDKLERVNTGTYHPIGLVILPINPNDNSFLDPALCHISSGSFKAPNPGWNGYGYKVDGTRDLYNYPIYNSSYYEVGIGIYTSVEPNNDGYVEFETQLEIYLPNTAIVDPTTQEAFKLYQGEELLYERDKTMQNLYGSFGLMEENHNASFKSLWQLNLEDGTPLGYNIQFIISKGSYDYPKLTLPVAIDLVQAINDELPLKFWINQVDYGRNEFWKTVIQTLNNKPIINDPVFTEQIFKNAQGFADLDWNEIGDPVNHGLYLTLAANYPSFGRAFQSCDIPVITLNCTNSIHSIGNSFIGYKGRKIVFLGNIQLQDLGGAFEFAANLEEVIGLKVANLIGTDDKGKYMTCSSTKFHFSFEGVGLEEVNIDAPVGEDIVVWPYAVQMFTGNCKLERITGAPFDFKLINPNDFDSWGVNPAYGHAIFGNAPIESIRIKNLNKGNWIIPCPFNTDSVNYLLNNIYDLTTNDGEHLERDDNSFNGWSHSYTNQETYKTIRFNHGHYAQITKTNWNGRKIFKLQASVTTQISLMLKDQGTIVLNQQFNIGTSETVIDRSANTFDEVRIGINLENSQNDVILTLSDPFDSAASLITSAVLNLTNVAYDSAFDAAIAVAQARGWTIVFAS